MGNEMGEKQAHLEIIQGVLNRLSSNSFHLKGWSVVLVSALFALAAGNTKPQFVYLAYFPAIAFWVLDGYFLWQEKVFRALYDHVRQMKEEEIDFSMDTSLVKGQVARWPDVILRMPLLIFHGTVVISIVVVMIMTWMIGKGA
jgi:hypothetical protein